MPCPADCNSGRRFLPVFGFLVILMTPFQASSTVDIRMQTSLGGIDIVLRDDIAPETVANFSAYMDSGEYDGTFIHRSIPGFVVQGGGYRYNPDDGPFFGGGASHIPEKPPVVNEAGLPGALSNVRGTLAMAKKAPQYDADNNLIPGTGPDSATSEWFFNLADNSANLDSQNGGFTVFAQVLGDDMDVVDSMATQDVCGDIVGLGFLCGTFSDTIVMGSSQVSFFNADGLLLVNHIGIDSDGDGVIDRVEDAAPNGGDANADGTVDSIQTNVASFDVASGGYASLQSPPGTVLDSVDVLDPNFLLAHPPTTFCELKGLDFSDGFAGINVTGVTPGAPVDVELQLPDSVVPDTFYSFGSTPDNPDPHWFRFIYDGETGAEIHGNSVTLHYVDGKRGDSDMDNSNGIVSGIGGPGFNLGFPADNDGVAGSIEDGAPNGGDANNDGIVDSEQGNVASFTDLTDTYLTLEAGASTPVRLVSANAAVPPQGASVLNGLNFTHGFIEFDVCADPDTTVRMILPEGESAETYYMFGPTPDNPEPHYYEFLFDGETGAEFSGNIVTLHFVDGKRGDGDLLANGIVSDPGGPAVGAEVAGAASSSGGGCTINSQRVPAQAGAWWVLLVALYLLCVRRGCSRELSRQSWATYRKNLSSRF